MIQVEFVYYTGIRREILENVRLTGSWTAHGRFSESWSAPIIMQPRSLREDDCPSFACTVAFDESALGSTFRWGIRADTAQKRDLWAIPFEVNDRFATDRTRSFQLSAAIGRQEFYLTNNRRIGAQKHYDDRKAEPGVQFSVWAPNAQKVELVAGKYNLKLGSSNTGYITDQGDGIDTAFTGGGVFPMTPGPEGIHWTSLADPAFQSFKVWDHRPYMFRVTGTDGVQRYRTDLCSRCQIGKGAVDPKGGPYTGSYRDLDGTKSCSIVIDPDTVTREFKESQWPETVFDPAETFWEMEFDAGKPVPRSLQDLVIYELHVGSLGFGKAEAGDFGDLIGANGTPNFLDYLLDLGVNAIELLPVLQYEGVDHWGYGTSHPYALEFSSGGRDQLKHVIRECHRRGLAVILDVVFNHYNADAERGEWGYDSPDPTRNAYYWYEGVPSDYQVYEIAAQINPVKNPPGQGGYLDNYSTGYTPRLYEELIRKWMIGSAVALVEEFHVDGLRVDLPQALYQNNVRHGDGVAVPAANDFGAKFLRELTRTLKMVKPGCMLIAEDHSDRAEITDSVDKGGFGFDATWYSTFYHHLIGDGKYGSDYARLLYVAGLGGETGLAMDKFARALDASAADKVVYSEDHDDAGNAEETERTMVTAVRAAPMVGLTRYYAENRCRCVAGLMMLSAGTPMFLMGEEIASVNPLLFKDFLPFREDLFAQRVGNGACMFCFYQSIIRLRLSSIALRSRSIAIVHIHNNNRIIAFVRGSGSGKLLVVASLNNQPYSAGYSITHPAIEDGEWREIFNSDGAVYGGDNVGNYGQALSALRSQITVVIPANGFVVLEHD